MTDRYRMNNTPLKGVAPPAESHSVIAILIAGLVLGAIVSRWIPFDRLPIPSILVAESAPFESSTLAVLIVEETSERSSLSAEQRAAIEGIAIRAAVKDAGGVFLQIDKDPTWAEGVDRRWKAAFEGWKTKGAGKTPWIVIAHGRRGTSQAITSERQALDLVAKFK